MTTSNNVLAASTLMGAAQIDISALDTNKDGKLSVNELNQNLPQIIAGLAPQQQKNILKSCASVFNAAEQNTGNAVNPVNTASANPSTQKPGFFRRIWNFFTGDDSSTEKQNTNSANLYPSTSRQAEKPGFFRRIWNFFTGDNSANQTCTNNTNAANIISDARFLNFQNARQQVMQSIANETNIENQSKLIAQIIDKASSGLGTIDYALQGAIYSINDKNYPLVESYLLQNGTTYPNRGIASYIDEENSSKVKKQLLNHLEKAESGAKENQIREMEQNKITNSKKCKNKRKLTAKRTNYTNGKLKKTVRTYKNGNGTIREFKDGSREVEFIDENGNKILESYDKNGIPQKSKIIKKASQNAKKQNKNVQPVNNKPLDCGVNIITYDSPIGSTTVTTDVNGSYREIKQENKDGSSTFTKTDNKGNVLRKERIAADGAISNWSQKDGFKIKETRYPDGHSEKITDNGNGTVTITTTQDNGSSATKTITLSQI